MAGQSIDTTPPHYKGKFTSIYAVNEKYPKGGVDGDYVDINGWAHYWDADRSSWCVNANRDEYWDEILTSLSEQLVKLSGATYMGLAIPTTQPVSSTANIFYLSTTKGEYVNFGSVVLGDGLSILYSSDGTWYHQTLISILQEEGESESALISQSAITKILNQMRTNIKSISLNLDKKFDSSSISQNVVNDSSSVPSSSAVYVELSKLSKELKGSILQVKKQVDSITIPKLAHMTESAYDALESKDDDTYYFLTEE